MSSSSSAPATPLEPARCRQLHLRLPPETDKLLDLITAAEGVERVDFTRNALATAMGEWLRLKSESLKMKGKPGRPRAASEGDEPSPPTPAAPAVSPSTSVPAPMEAA